LSDDSLLSLLHYEKSRAQPDQHRNCSNEAGSNTRAFHVRLKATAARTIAPTAPAPTTATITTKKVSKFAVEVFPELIKVGGAALGTTGTTATSMWLVTRVGWIWRGFLLGARGIRFVSAS
jgi:hypothetical protein